MQSIIQFKLCKNNFKYFLKFVKISDIPSLDNPNGVGVMSFQMWPHLEKAIQALLSKKFIAWLKSRQIGASWLIASYALWYALFKKSADIYMFSYGEREAFYLLGKCKFIHKNLPDFLKLPVDKYSESEITFPSMFSGIHAMPSSPQAGIGMTASMIICDEWEWHPYAQENWLQAKPGIDSSGGQFIGIFTRDKTKLNPLATTVFKEALEGKNGFFPLFDDYKARPGRGEEWYEAEKKRNESNPLGAELYMEQNYPRCLAGETLISTDEGLIQISNSKYGFSTGEKELYLVETDCRRELKISIDHLIMTPDGYKPLGDLQIGDAIKLKAPQFTQSVQQVKLPLNFHIVSPFISPERQSSTCLSSHPPLLGLGRDKPRAMPVVVDNETRLLTIDERWARFLGLFVGDGCISGNVRRGRKTSQTLSIVCDAQDVDLINLVTKDFTELFGDYNIRQCNKAKAVEIRKSQIGMVDFFNALGLVKSSGELGQALRKVCVPQCILRSPSCIIRAFLSGIFEADGSVYRQQRHSRILLCSKSIEFLRTIQFLLLGFGITSKIRSYDATAVVQGEKHKYHTNELTLRKPEVEQFALKIGFLSKRKRALCNNEPISNSNHHPKPIAFIDNIKSITLMGIMPVWDASISPEHCFSANGIYVHNSIEEALRVGGTAAAFNTEVLSEMMLDTKNPIKLPDIDINYEIINIYKPFQMGHYYISAADIAHGGGKDYTVAGIMDVKTGEVVADIMRNDLSVEVFAEHYLKLLKLYRNPKCAPEDNDRGHAVILIMQQAGYKNFVYQETMNKDGIKGIDKSKPGWHTDRGNRAKALEQLIPAIDNRQITIYNRSGVEQLGYLIRNVEKEGRIEAASGGNDDYAMMLAIAWASKSQVKTEDFVSKSIRTLEF